MTSFFMAWGMFCVIPCPWKKWDETKYSRMLLCLPLIGLVIGGVWLLVAWLLGMAGGLGMFGVAVLAVLPYVLSGFIHLDGFMDCADAILSQRDQAERRRILKDSRVGSFAVICVCILMLLSFSLFAERGAGPGTGLLCLLFIPAVSRSCAAAAVLGFSPMETSSYARMESERGGRNPAAVALGLMLVFVALPVIFCGLPGLCGLGAAIGSGVTILYCRHNLGGMSGDISGCGITVGELCAVAVWVLV